MSTESIFVTIDDQKIEIDTDDIINADYVGQMGPEFRIYSDGRFTLESELNDGEGCMWNATADDETFSALGYERVLDSEGNETNDLVFIGEFEGTEYVLNSWIRERY